MPIQRRMNVGASDDPHEREADRVADDVVRRLAGSDRPAGSDGVRVGAASRISRRESGGAPGDGFVAPAGVERSIQQARSGGAPLDATTRTKFEGAMGADLSGVRIHKDANADQLNRQVSAKAFTTGQDVFFSAGTYQPNSSAGQHLLAHELAHTVQQGGSVQRRATDSDSIQRKLDYKNTAWADATSISASGGASLTGVFFLKDASGASIAIKPASGGARNALAAEIVDMSGAHGADQRVIPLASPEGQQMVQVMQKLASKYRKKHKTKKGQNPIKVKIAHQLESGKFDSVIIMAGYDNLTNIADLTGEDNFLEIFDKMVANGFFGGLGRTHAADMMMGNEDRLDHMNEKNIFVNIWSGQNVALDLDLNAASFDQVTKALPDEGGTASAGGHKPSLEGHQYKDFVTYSIDGHMGKKTVENKKGAKVQSRMMSRGGAMATSEFTKASDPAKAAAVFEQFKDMLILQGKLVGKGSDAVLAAFDWSGPKKQFLQGVADGMKALAAKMGNISKRSGELSAEHGEDNFLDPNVFRVRGMYYQLLQMGMPDAEARDVLEMYGEHILRGGTDEMFMQWVAMYSQQAIAKQAAAKPAPVKPAQPKAPLRRPGLADLKGVKMTPRVRKRALVANGPGQ